MTESINSIIRSKAPISMILLWLLCVSHVAAQDTLKNRRLSYGLMGQGVLNNRLLTANSSESWVKSKRNTEETGRTGFAAGILLNYRLTDRFSINSGLTLLDMGFKTKKEALGWTDGSPSTIAFTGFHFQYIQLPLDLKYRYYTTQRFSLYVAGGVSPVVFIGKATTIHYDGDTHTDHQAVGYNRFNFVADVQAGVDYSISKRLTLSGGLLFRQFINAANANLPVKEHLNSSGITAAIIYTPQKRAKHN